MEAKQSERVGEGTGDKGRGGGGGGGLREAERTNGNGGLPTGSPDPWEDARDRRKTLGLIYGFTQTNLLLPGPR